MVFERSPPNTPSPFSALSVELCHRIAAAGDGERTIMSMARACHALHDAMQTYPWGRADYRGKFLHAPAPDSRRAATEQHRQWRDLVRERRAYRGTEEGDADKSDSADSTCRAKTWLARADILYDRHMPGRALALLPRDPQLCRGGEGLLHKLLLMTHQEDAAAPIEAKLNLEYALVDAVERGDVEHMHTNLRLGAGLHHETRLDIWNIVRKKQQVVDNGGFYALLDACRQYPQVVGWPRSLLGYAKYLFCSLAPAVKRELTLKVWSCIPSPSPDDFMSLLQQKPDACAWVLRHMTTADPVSLGRSLLREKWRPTGTGAYDLFRHLSSSGLHSSNVLAALGRTDVLAVSLQDSEGHTSLLKREILLVLSASTPIGEYKRSNGLHSLLLLWQRAGGEEKVSELMLSVFRDPSLWRRRKGRLRVTALKVFAEYGGMLSLSDVFALPGILEKKWRTAPPTYEDLPPNRRQDLADITHHLLQHRAIRPFSASDEKALRRAFPGKTYENSLCRELRELAEPSARA